MVNKPNIILFITHDQGQFLNCYNTPQTPNSLYTPYIDKIAEKGVKFTNYFCTAPQCSPSRGSIQTSLYPHQNGLMGLVNRGWTLPENNKTIPMYLKDNGYSTHLLGLQHESSNESTLGYDTISKRSSVYKYSCKRMENGYFRFFSDHSNDAKPFFVNIGTIDVHRPFKAWAEPVDPKSVRIPPFLPDNEMIREDLAEYYGTINNVDITIGKIIECLETTGLKENTLFIYTTDHGSPFPRSKCTLYDPGLKTILIMFLPNSKLFSGEKIVNSMLSNIDLLPSLLEFIGAKIPKKIEGKSFLSILKGETKEVRREIYAEKTFHEFYDPIRCIRSQNFKYIRNFEKLDTLYQIPGDVLRDLSGKYIKKIYVQPRMEEEFYNLKDDPMEQNNLINDPEYENIVSKFREQLFNWMKRTNDPILKGKVKSQANFEDSN